jgi:acetyl esterase
MGPVNPPPPAGPRRTSPGPAATAAEGAAPPDGRRGGRPGGRPGEGGTYDRRRQRAREWWPPITRLLAWFLRHPEAILTVLGRREPVTVDGRVLNRSVQAMLAVTQALPLGGDTTLDPPAARRRLARMAGLAMPVRTDVHVTGREVPAPETPVGSGPIPLRIYRRFGSGVGAGVGLGHRPPAIVYFHGGGWVAGDLRSHDGSCRLLASVSGCLVVAVDYRLAPEHPYPAAVDDAVAAFRWTQRHADGLGVDPGRIGVMGDSAGGNLAAVVSLLTREGGGAADPDLPGPWAQGLVYPAVSARVHTPTHELDDGFFLTMAGIEQMRDAYVPDRSTWDTPSVSPLLAEVAGAAPALVVTAGFDLLRADGDAYARKLADAGVAVEHRVYDDQVHGFFGMGLLADSLALSVEVADAMGRLMHRPEPAPPDPG